MYCEPRCPRFLIRQLESKMRTAAHTNYITHCEKLLQALESQLAVSCGLGNLRPIHDSEMVKGSCGSLCWFLRGFYGNMCDPYHVPGELASLSVGSEYMCAVRASSCNCKTVSGSDWRPKAVVWSAASLALHAHCSHASSDTSDGI